MTIRYQHLTPKYPTSTYIGGSKIMTPWSVFLNLGYLPNRIKLLDTASLLLNIDVHQSQANRTIGQNRLFLVTTLSA
jgi:hypothetical protein